MNSVFKTGKQKEKIPDFMLLFDIVCTTEKQVVDKRKFLFIEVF